MEHRPDRKCSPLPRIVCAAACSLLLAGACASDSGSGDPTAGTGGMVNPAAGGDGQLSGAPASGGSSVAPGGTGTGGSAAGEPTSGTAGIGGASVATGGASVGSGGWAGGGGSGGNLGGAGGEAASPSGGSGAAESGGSTTGGVAGEPGSAAGNGTRAGGNAGGPGSGGGAGVGEVAGAAGIGQAGGGAGGAGSCQAPANYQSMAAEDLRNALEDHVGLEVAFTTDVQVSTPTCTLLICDEDPCCNACEAALSVLGMSADLADGEMLDVGCSGTNCDYGDNCNPPALVGEHLVWGVVQEYYGSYQIALDGYCP